MKTEITHVSLFSGVGMTELGIKLVLPIKTILYCEIDEYCQKVLKARIADGALADAPIHDDVTTLNPADYDIAECDIISGGFPCQDISCAGKGEGLKGARSGLFYEIMRIAGDLRPRYILLENVSALLARGLDAVLGALSEAGYDAVWTSIRASDVGAPHRRERVFVLGIRQGQSVRPGLCTLGSPEVGRRRCGDASGESGAVADAPHDPGTGLAHAQGRGAAAEEQPRQGHVIERKTLWPLGYGPTQHAWEPPRLMAHSGRTGRTRRGNKELQQAQEGRIPRDGRNRPTQPRLGRRAHGRSHRVDRLRALGNGIVPQQLAAALIELFGAIT